jgi:hypothetical protein
MQSQVEFLCLVVVMLMGRKNWLKQLHLALEVVAPRTWNGIVVVQEATMAFST